MLAFQIVYRYFRSGSRFVNTTTFLSCVGLMIGVACLVVMMAVVSGFESTIKAAVEDLSGHILVVKRGSFITKLSHIEPLIKKQLSTMEASTPFVHLEAVLAHGGKVSGVIIEGFEAKTVHKVLSLKKRIIKGKFNISKFDEDRYNVVIGKQIAKNFKLKIGDELKIILPKPSKTQRHRFHPKLKKFILAGVADLGKYEYDERFIIMSDRAAQSLAGAKKNHYTGVRIKISDSDNAPQYSLKLSSELPPRYFTKDWFQINERFFEALKLEKLVIFVVMLIMVIVACFNISSSLFISVLKKYGDIGILKSIGAGPSLILKIFTLQGLLVGFVGSFGGVLLGYIFCYLISQYQFVDVPADIYRIDHLPVEIRWRDLVNIVISSFSICFLSSLLPAIKGSKMKPVEGLRYE